MSKSRSRRLCVVTVAVTLAVGTVVLFATAGGAAPHVTPPGPIETPAQTQDACGAVTGLRARCEAVQFLDPGPAAVSALARPDRGRGTTTSTSSTTTSSTTTSSMPVTTTSTTSGGTISCSTAHAGYTPCDLQSAYSLPSQSAGKHETVAIVDAYNDPNAEADLGTYRTTFGLPACTTANGCFRKVTETGGTRYPTGNVGWSEEISLDVDMVSAACPNCHILLVEAASNNLSDLLAAENEAAALGANSISNSWTATEFSTETSYDSYFHHNIPITASTGDTGYGVGWPAASPYVTAAGGTSLSRAANARGWSETAWSGTGSGCSAYEAKPAWQTNTGCANRAVADVSAVADPNTGVATYDSYGESGWLVFGGTSVASPIIASVYALAGNGAAVITPAYAYANQAALNDVTSGSNGTCAVSDLCTAGPGYDGPTGLGTPDGTGAF